MERLVTTAQAAEILGLSLQGIHYRIKKNQLKSVKQAGKTFVYVNDDDTRAYNQNIKVEAVNNKQENISPNPLEAVIEVKNEQIGLLKKAIKWMRKQHTAEIERLEDNHKKVVEVFNSEIKLLQSAFNEMRSIYKPQIENNTKKEIAFISLKEFFIFMKKNGKTEKEIKNVIFQAIQRGDKRFIYNKTERKLLIIDSDFQDLV